mmetsp:Transcript_9627/g.21379  ORF Transcript_9627/g.21379 Transcript_9627/m.21379 type:complete len:93 (+) Transcript_9627:299-577(+)
MKAGVETLEIFCYKQCMFGIPIERSTSLFCGNEAIYQNTMVPESILKKKHHSIIYHRCHEVVAAPLCQKCTAAVPMAPGRVFRRGAGSEDEG